MRILLAVDDSESAQLAVAAIAALRPPAHLVLLHVVDVLPYPRMSEDYYRKMLDSLVRSGHDLLDEIKALLPSDFKSVGIRILVGKPIQMILEGVTQHHPDLLVLGSRGLDPLQEWYVGGVSYHVAAQAPCPVLLIKRPLEKIQKVLLAYDGSDEADRAADFLDRDLFRDPVEVAIVTVWPEQPAMPAEVESQGDTFTQRAKQAAVELAEKIKGRLPPERFSCRVEVVEGDPGKTLARLAKQRGTDIVVLGARKLGWMKRLFLGSVSHSVVHRAPCAVLVVKGKDVPNQEENMPASENKARSGEKERSPDEWRACLLCGKPASESICEHCKISVQAEALSQKRRIEKGGAS